MNASECRETWRNLLLRLTGGTVRLGRQKPPVSFSSTIMLIPLIASAVRYANASPYSVFNNVPTPDVEGESPDSAEFWYKVVLSIGLVLLGGVFAGYAFVGNYEVHLFTLLPQFNTRSDGSRRAPPSGVSRFF